METNDRKHQENILHQFFGDKNVNFPKYPKIVNGIHVYETPQGLGIQFRGGAEKFLIRGADCYKNWRYLKEVLDGTHSLEQILNFAKDNYSLDALNVGILLKTLHSYHLLEPHSNSEWNSIEMHFTASLWAKTCLRRSFPFDGKFPWGN